MTGQLRATIGVNLKFFGRNRLLLGIGALFLALMALPFAASVLTESLTQKFNLLRMLYDELDMVATVFTAGIGLFVISSHLRNKSLKLVFTKPCLPETWLASAFLSVMLASAALFLAAFAITAGLGVVWHVPFQAGLVFVSIEAFFRSLILVAYLMFLATAVHPVIAVLTLAMFNESTFEGLRFLLAARAQGSGGGHVAVLQWACDSLYFLLPALAPFRGKTEAIHASLRVASGDWLYLLGVGAYAAVVLVLFFLLSTAVLRRKQLT
jgi:hypothetical protein